MPKETQKIVDEYNQVTDYSFVNEIIKKSGKIDDFEMNKTTLLNISEWALNGNSDEEIRKRLELTPTQWKFLVSVCPTMVLVMRDSRALADVIIAGSLFQTAIGGKRVSKQVAKSVTEYDDKGKPCGQHLETIELWEELPPNADLLKFLATHKLSEKFSDKQTDRSEDYSKVLDKLTPEQIAIIEMASKKGVLDEKDSNRD